MKDKKDNYLDSDYELDFKEFFYVLLDGKWLIISLTTFISIIAVLYSLMLPNIYKSQALLSPTDATSGISRSLRGYSGIANLAGVSLPSGDTDSNSAKAIKKLNSLSFFEFNILPKIFLPNLMALKSWDANTNSIIYDSSLYNDTANVWVRDFSYPQKQIPSAQESFEVFKEILSISSDDETGFVSISIKHQSPLIAKEWTNLVISEINSYYRKKDKLESQTSADFLNAEIAKTSLAQVKEVIAELLQEETQKLALVEAKEFYVFDYIDPPSVMEKKAEPKRSLICIFGAFLGLMLGMLIVLVRHYVLK